MASSAIRVLVVDDSALVRQIVVRVLADDRHIEVVGTARNGVEALEKAASLDPDVITLDIEMPELDGIEVLRRLDRHSKSRVVVLSSIDDPATTYLALSLGAVEFVVKPTAGVATAVDELAATLRAKIRTAYHVAPGRASAVARISARVASMAASASLGGHATQQPAPNLRPRVCVALAASTGGPPALEVVLSSVSGDLPAAFVVVQHLPAGFSASLARRLSGAGDVSFQEAESGMALEAGCGYVAPYGAHLAVASDGAGVRRFAMLPGPPMHGIRPAADPLFESVAKEFGTRAVGVVLTGMGSDGALGAKRIREAGGQVIAQDEATSVIWGMPRATLRMAALDGVVALDLIGGEICRCVLGSVSKEAS